MSLKTQNVIDNDNNLIINPEKFQIMFMSMGEPFHNYSEMEMAIKILNEMFPTAYLLVSTSAPKSPSHYKSFIELSRDIDKIGLQFSVHKSNDADRSLLVPFKNKMTLAEFRDYGVEWWKETGRKPYCNYCVDGKNSTENDFNNLRNLFPPNVFCFTFSVVCSYDETMKDAGYRNLEEIRKFENKFLEHGYDTRIFDPAGQDDIGGGCGQLFYVQKWLKNYKK
jgi:23S rRNA (adenine2503-C2)-methyltransferase